MKLYMLGVTNRTTKKTTLTRRFESQEEADQFRLNHEDTINPKHWVVFELEVELNAKILSTKIWKKRKSA